MNNPSRAGDRPLGHQHQDPTSQPAMTAAEWHAQSAAERGIGWTYELALAERNPDAVKPWVVLAFKRNPSDMFHGVAIVAGHNRWTGEVISWHVRDFDDERYDLSRAVEVK